MTPIYDVIRTVSIKPSRSFKRRDERMIIIPVSKNNDVDESDGVKHVDQLLLDDIRGRIWLNGDPRLKARVMELCKRPDSVFVWCAERFEPLPKRLVK